jgi:copper chaperone
MSNLTELKIEGMSCGHCVRAVKQALESVPGVQTAEVTLTPGGARVSHDGTATVAAMVAAVDEEGYAAEEAR